MKPAPPVTSTFTRSSSRASDRTRAKSAERGQHRCDRRERPRRGRHHEFVRAPHRRERAIRAAENLVGVENVYKWRGVRSARRTPRQAGISKVRCVWSSRFPFLRRPNETFDAPSAMDISSPSKGRLRTMGPTGDDSGKCSQLPPKIATLPLNRSSNRSNKGPRSGAQVPMKTKSNERERRSSESSATGR